MIVKYRTPSNKIFQEIKDACIKVWKTYDNTYGYVDEKIRAVNYIKNEEANVMFMLKMFHPILKAEIISHLSVPAKKYIQYYDNLER